MDSKHSIHPHLFHQHHSDNVEDIQFWMNLAEKSGGAVLELGCGTGRVTSQLVKLDQQIVGLDINFDMLSIFKDNFLMRSRTAVNIFQADMRFFRLNVKFSLVFLACNMFSTLTETARLRVIKLAYQHLSNDGWFAASIPNPLNLAELPDRGETEVETEIFHPISNNPLQISSEWEKDGQSIIFRWHYDHLLPDGNVERSTTENRHLINDPAAYNAEFLEAGYTSITNYGDYDKASFNQDSPYLIMVARKRGKF